jgi:hypothetical protein
MRHSLRAALFVLPLLLTFAICLAAQKQDSSALINEALDKPVEVQLNTTLPNALREIKNKTGVPIELAPGVLDLLPWGDQTNLNVKIANQTLRQAISTIARTLGLVYVLTPESVELRPMPALQRMGRRATVDELQILDVLATSPANLKNTRPTLAELLEAIDKRLIELKSQFAVDYRRSPAITVKDDQPIAVSRNATLGEALDAISRDTPLAWGPWGQSVLLKPKEAWVRDQLEKLVTRRFEALDVGQVLSDLSDFSGVDFTIEPGAVQRIPQPSRTITLILENRSIAQVLELIAGFTGLNYSVNDRGVYFWNQSAGGSGSGSSDPVIAMLTMPDSGIQVMLRTSQVPDDLRQYIRHRMGKEMDKLRAMMEAEGFVPTTQPAPTTQETPKDL